MAYNEFKTADQVNYGWNLTWNATGKFPIIAKRAFETLADAQGYINDKDDTACEGLILAVFNDPVEKNNGIYLVKSVGDGVNPGVLVPAGSGTGSTTAANYTAAKALATADNVGQIIYVLADETSTTELAPESTEDNPVYVVYTAGPYIVTGAGTVAKLGTTSASGDIAGDVETLKGKVGDLESSVSTLSGSVNTINDQIEGIGESISDIEESIESISGSIAELKVKDVQVGGNSIAVDGIVTVDNEFVDESTSTNLITHAAIAAKIKGLAEQISEIPKFDIEVVETLPTENISNSTVYLVVSPTEGVKEDGENIYTEYIYVNDTWEKLGEQKLDLSNYLTSSDAESTYVKKTDISSYDFAQIAANKSAIETISEAINKEGGLADRIEANEGNIETLQSDVEGLSNSLTGEGGLSSRIEANEGNIETLQSETIVAGEGDDYITAEVGDNRTLNVTATIGSFTDSTNGLATVNAVKNYVESSLEWIDVE